MVIDLSQLFDHKILKYVAWRRSGGVFRSQRTRWARERSQAPYSIGAPHAGRRGGETRIVAADRFHTAPNYYSQWAPSQSAPEEGLKAEDCPATSVTGSSRLAADDREHREGHA